MHFSIDRTVHTTAFDKPVVDLWLERKIAQTAAGSTEKDRSDDRPLQRLARYRLSYMPLPGPDERFANACVDKRHRFVGDSVMVWGGISHRFKTPFGGNLTTIRYRDEILQCPLSSETTWRFNKTTRGRMLQECVGTSLKRTTSTLQLARLQPRSVPHRSLVGSVGQDSEESFRPTNE